MELKKASIKYLPKLKAICTEAYAKNFHNHWNDNGMDLYLEKEFNDAKLTLDLNNHDVDYYFIIANVTTVGFIKTKNTSLPGLLSSKSVELEKIYVLPEYKGRGYGKKALTEIIGKATIQEKKILFLCVIDSNKGAIAFYKKLGFKFHSKTRLDVPYFKEELKGMHRMYLELS
ncbi:MAG: GNAT family N-acetyltransferase [Cellulophaga sp.]